MPGGPAEEVTVLAFQRILCPVDSSPFSERALSHAVALGRWYEADVLTLSVRPAVLLPALWLTGALAVPFEEPGADLDAQQALGDFARRLAGGYPVRAMVTSGQVDKEILRVAGDERSDLIVMGTHGLGGFDRLVLGSVTEKILRKAGCPVMVVPPAAAASDTNAPVTFRTIVCGMDRSEASKLALDYALSLAQQSGGRLVLVHALEDFANEDPQFARHFNTEACWREAEPEIRAAYDAQIPDEARVWCDVEIRTPRGKPYRGVLDTAADSDAALIVIGAAGWNAPFGSTTQRVVREAPCPVLVAPVPEP